MSPLSKRQLLFSIAIGIVPATVAQVCTPPYGEYGYAYNPTNQSSLDLLAQQCTTINGSIVIANNFTGPFYLPNIQNITGTIEQIPTNYTPSVVASLTSLELPDLEYLDWGLYFVVPTLANVSVPKLKTTEIILLNYVQHVDFSSLESAQSVSIYGNLSSLQLGSLQNVEGVLDICNTDACNLTEYPAGVLDISLSSLQSAEALFINGTMTSLDLPNLTTLGNSSLGIGGLVVVSNPAVSVNLSFPLLNTTLDSLSFQGNISSISMPRMLDLSNVWFSMDVSAPLNIDFPVQDASIIQLVGSIESVTFPNLTSLQSFSVNSTLPLDCDSLDKTIQQQTNTSSSEITCTSTSSAKNLSGSLKTVAIGVVAAVVGAAMVI